MKEAMTLNGQPIDFETTVVDESNYFASAVIVKGKQRFYGFPPRSTVTRIGEFIVIRGYGGIFIYEGRDVVVRRLARQEPLEFGDLPIDGNQTILDALAKRNQQMRPSDDVCPDCVLPIVVRNV